MPRKPRKPDLGIVALVHGAVPPDAPSDDQDTLVQVAEVAVTSVRPARSAQDFSRRPASGSPPLARATRRYRSSQSSSPGDPGYQVMAA